MSWETHANKGAVWYANIWFKPASFMSPTKLGHLGTDWYEMLMKKTLIFFKYACKFCAKQILLLTSSQQEKVTPDCTWKLMALQVKHWTPTYSGTNFCWGPHWLFYWSSYFECHLGRRTWGNVLSFLCLAGRSIRYNKYFSQGLFIWYFKGGW